MRPSLAGLPPGHPRAPPGGLPALRATLRGDVIAARLQRAA